MEYIIIIFTLILLLVLAIKKVGLLVKLYSGALVREYQNGERLAGTASC